MYIEDFNGVCEALGLASSEGDWDHKTLPDGLYEVQADTVVLEIEHHNGETAVREFCAAHPNWICADAYETHTPLLLSQPPIKRPDLKVTGTGFNYGANALIEGCPARLLVIAEDD